MTNLEVQKTDNEVTTVLNWWQMLALVMSFNTLVYVIALCKKDLSIVDVVWGLLFIIPNAAIMYLRSRDEPPSPTMIIVLSMLIIWGVRLSLHIGCRHKGEDYRYTQMRKSWVKFGYVASVYIIPYIQVYLLQGVISLVVNAPAVHVLLYSDLESGLSLWEYVGSTMFFVGLMMEVVADAQLQEFRDRKARGELQERVLTTGLWRYSRHPNYFGDAFLWWGIYVIACGTSGGYTTIYGPLLMTLLLRFVSGVAMLEEKQKQKAEFRVYMMETNAFFPWFVTHISDSERANLLARFEKEIELEKLNREKMEQIYDDDYAKI